MLRLKNIEKEQFDQFIVKNKNTSHFLQSLSWAEFSKIKKNLTPYYLGLVNEKDELITAILLLQKKLPLNYSYFYVPRGFIIDYNKKELLQVLTTKIINFIKSKNGIFLRLSPNIKQDNKEILNILKKNGYKQINKNKEFLQNHVYQIDLSNTLDKISNNLPNTTKELLTKSTNLDTVITIGNKKDISEFFNLLKNNTQNSKDYYETLYEIFNGNKTSKANIFIEKLHITKTIKSLEKRKKLINNQISILPIDNLSDASKLKLKDLSKEKENINNDIKKYQEYKEKYGNMITLSMHFTIEYDNKMWNIYSVNNKNIDEDYLGYNNIYEQIKYCKNNNINIYNRIELFNKEKENEFNEEYIKYIGEWDLVTNHLIYFIYNILLNIKRKIKESEK